MTRNLLASNEDRVCEAIVAMLERELKAAREDLTFPERDGSGPPVEMRLTLRGQSFAIEHTLLEPFPGAINAGLAFAELAEDLRTRLHGTMPAPGTYELIFPVDPASRRHRRTYSALRARIEEWVIAAAQEMQAECPERLPRDVSPRGYFERRSTAIEGLDLVLRRRVHWSESGKHDGSLFLTRSIGDDLEEQRRARLAAALAKKLPKLSACKAEGDHTVLILEYSDIALTNHGLVAEHLEALWSERSDWPDEVVIVDTTCEGNWHAVRPVLQGQLSMELAVIEL